MFKYLLEDNSGFYQLEDGSGDYLLEDDMGPGNGIYGIDFFHHAKVVRRVIQRFKNRSRRGR